MAGPQSGRPWRQTRDRVVRRDHGRCHLCGQPGATSADHLVPVAHGGALHDLGNLAACHIDCNKIRGTRSIERARADIAARLAAVDASSNVPCWTW